MVTENPELPKNTKEILRISSSINFHEIYMAIEEYAESLKAIPERYKFASLAKEEESRKDLIRKIDFMGKKFSHLELKLKQNQIKEKREEAGEIYYAAILLDHEMRNFFNSMGFVDLALEEFDPSSKESNEEFIQAGHIFDMVRSIGLSSMYLATKKREFNTILSTELHEIYPYITGDFSERTILNHDGDHQFDAITLTSLVQCIKNGNDAYERRFGSNQGLVLDIESSGRTFRINNNGTNISRENITKIFYDFTSGDKLNGDEGKGFGLQIMRRGAELEEKQIYVSSQDEDGTPYTYNPITNQFLEPRYVEGTTFELTYD